MTAQQNQVRPGSWSIPGQCTWQTSLLCMSLYQSRSWTTTGLCCSLGQLFPLFTPSRKEEIVNKEKIQGIVLHGASSRISGGQEMVTYSLSESNPQEDLENANSPSWASVFPPAQCGHRGYFMPCLSHKWGKEAGALPIVFGPQLQAMAQMPLLSVSLE